MLLLVRSRLQACARIALVAVAALALVPTLSHALAATQASTPWSDICTTAGAVDVRGDAGRPGSASAELVHCALCIVAHGAPPLPAGLSALPPTPQAAQVAVPWPAPPTRAWPLHHAIQPRAPPAAA